MTSSYISFVVTLSIIFLIISNFVSIYPFNQEIIELIEYEISFNFFDSEFLNSLVFSDKKI